MIAEIKKNSRVLIAGNEPAINFLLQRFCQQLQLTAIMASQMNSTQQKPVLIIYSDLVSYEQYRRVFQQTWPDEILTVLCENGAEGIERNKVDVDLILTQPLSFLTFSSAMDELGIMKLS